MFKQCNKLGYLGHRTPDTGTFVCDLADTVRLLDRNWLYDPRPLCYHADLIRRSVQTLPYCDSAWCNKYGTRKGC